MVKINYFKKNANKLSIGIMVAVRNLKSIKRLYSNLGERINQLLSELQALQNEISASDKTIDKSLQRLLVLINEIINHMCLESFSITRKQLNKSKTLNCSLIEILETFPSFSMA